MITKRIRWTLAVLVFAAALSGCLNPASSDPNGGGQAPDGGGQVPDDTGGGQNTISIDGTSFSLSYLGTFSDSYPTGIDVFAFDLGGLSGTVPIAFISLGIYTSDTTDYRGRTYNLDPSIVDDLAFNPDDGEFVILDLIVDPSGASGFGSVAFPGTEQEYRDLSGVSDPIGQFYEIVSGTLTVDESGGTYSIDATLNTSGGQTIAFNYTGASDESF